MAAKPKPTHYTNGRQTFTAEEFEARQATVNGTWRPLYPPGTYAQPPEDLTTGKLRLIVWGDLVEERPKVEELEAWFGALETLPEGPIQLDTGSQILDVRRFVDWSLICVKSNGSRELRAPFYYRLLALKHLIVKAQQ